MITYYHVKNNLLEDTLNFGMKLSDHAQLSIKTFDVAKKVIITYLTPADDIERFNNPDYTCLSINMPIDKNYVIEGSYMDLNNTNDLSASLVNANEYIIGSYRKPLVLLTTSVFSQSIKKLGKYMDQPILVENSKDLYIKNIIFDLEESDENFHERSLYAYLQTSKKARKLEENNNLVEFLINGKKYIVEKR